MLLVVIYIYCCMDLNLKLHSLKISLIGLHMHCLFLQLELLQFVNYWVRCVLGCRMCALIKQNATVHGICNRFSGALPLKLLGRLVYHPDFLHPFRLVTLDVWNVSRCVKIIFNQKRWIHHKFKEAAIIIGHDISCI